MSLVSDDPSDSSDSGLGTILYSVSSHAPRSTSLHRREQKGKNFASSDLSVGDTLILITYAFMNIEEAKVFKPSLVFPDEATNLLK